MLSPSLEVMKLLVVEIPVIWGLIIAGELPVYMSIYG
jgi:hypothetical protein